MKIMLILASLAALSGTALFATETSSQSQGGSVGVLPEFVVTARRAPAVSSVGVLPEFVVTARRTPAVSAVGVLPELVVVARRPRSSVPTAAESQAPAAVPRAEASGTALAVAEPTAGSLSRM